MTQRRGTQWLCFVLLCCTVLWSWLYTETLSQASSVNMPRFIGCAVREFTFPARKPGCGGLHITTDACWGRCETWEKPVLDPPYIESYHRVCTYNETHLVTVQLPNCSANMDPMYPVALRCDCGALVEKVPNCHT
uniref:Glycoprotein hormone beta-5 n=1 Tax=Hucho hucho TaxID=62062 RepID=A0A4W5QMN8_9TELE